MVPRAGREIDHEVALHRGELGHGVEAVIKAARADHRVRPNIFAQRDTDFFTLMNYDGGRGGGLEVAVFVKDVIGRQQALVCGGDDLAAVAKGGRVVECAAVSGSVERDGADDGRYVADGGGDFSHRIHDVGHEAPFQKQVAGRITAGDELGENDELSTLGDERGISSENFTAIAGEITDGRIKLGEAETHGSYETKSLWSIWRGATRKACRFPIRRTLLRTCTRFDFSSFSPRWRSQIASPPRRNR